MRLLHEAGSRSIQHLPREEDNWRGSELYPYLLFVEDILRLGIEDEVVGEGFSWSRAVKEWGRIDIDLYSDRCVLSL
jgi:hypothetical protein